MSLIRSCRIEWLERDGPGYAINPHIGCAYGCYAGCWAYLMAKRYGRVTGWQEWLTPRLDPEFQSASLEADVAREAERLPENARVLLSATCDPFQPGDFGHDETIKAILLGLASWRHKPPQLWVLTKSGKGMLRWMLWLQQCHARVGVTVTSLVPTGWEPRADPPRTRMEALHTAKQLGLSTYISIEPWIPAEVTDPRAIIEATREFTDHYIIGSFNYAGVDRSFYRSELPELVEWMDREHVSYFLKRELLHKGGVHLDKRA